VFAWVTALLAAGRVTRGIPAAQVSVPVLGRPALVVLALVSGCGLLAGLYRGRYQRGSLDEVARVMIAATATALCLALAAPALMPGRRDAPQVAVLLAAGLAALSMLGARYVAFAARLRSRPAARTAVKIIVFGAGDAGEQLIRRLVTRPGAEYRPVAILDDDPQKRQLRIHGVPVLGDRTQMAAVAARTGAGVLVIALAGASGQVIRGVTTAAEECGLVPKVIPSVQELLRGSARIESVRDPRISDLLGRRPVNTGLAAITSHFAGKRILVTGAGGSIGAELCRQLSRLSPAELVLLDRDESALHALELALHGHGLLVSDQTVLADIRSPARVREIFRRFRPQIVFHAAALKHLPLLERHPAEGLMTNVWGTLAVLEAAAACGVESFVNISTDKAANPVSVLGCTKRIAERLTAYMAAGVGGTYLSVRFGNVLGSNGSVITALSAQIAAGGPVTVTHPDVRRYFMTADEAVQLVLHAAVIGSGGEVLVLDMGEPVGIAEIARRLAGPEAIEIVYTGLRPGEKIMEDLLAHGEEDIRPSHPLISQVPVPPLAPAQVTGLDPDADDASLRLALSRCAGTPCPAAASLAHDPDAAGMAPGGQADQGAAVRPATWLRPLPVFGPAPGLAADAPRGNGARHLPAWPGRDHRALTRMSPAKPGQPGHQAVDEGSGLGVGLRRAPGRIGHVVVGGVSQHRRTVPPGVHARQPLAERLGGRPWPGLLAPADEFFHGERARPCLRGHDHGMPDVLAGHAKHELGPCQLTGSDRAAVVRGEIEPAGGHDRDHLRERGAAAGESSSGRDRQPHAQAAEPAGEQRRGHGRAADVGGAQHQHACLARHSLPPRHGLPPRHSLPLR
jgi:FlaA1/EpsC-like NDP-sugar epimerase